MARAFNSRHNVTAILDDTIPETLEFRQIISFLRRSRISYAISHLPNMWWEHIRDFWQNASYDCTVTPPVIRTTIHGNDIAVSEQTVREALHFNDAAADRIEFPATLVMGCFDRMNYNGPPNAYQKKKAHLSAQFRYLMHVLISCLSAKKGGMDALNKTLASAMVALTLNKPYNFSYLIFHELVQQINADAKHRFILYPRFVQMILDVLLPNLPHVGITLELTMMDRRIFADCKKYRGDPARAPIPTALFGHLIDENYPEPPEDNWFNPGEREAEVATAALQQQQQPPPQPIQVQVQQVAQPAPVLEPQAPDFEIAEVAEVHEAVVDEPVAAVEGEVPDSDSEDTLSADNVQGG